MDDEAHRRTGAAGESAGLTVFAYMISGPLVYGGAGFLLDRWLGWGFLLPVGLVVGVALALYLITVRYRTR